ncbi:MAG: amidohydrolase family protein [Oscillospiraceae bacterium]|nr:amidohydrolase family protein [Oscillospiraceae bacterium]
MSQPAQILLKSKYIFTATGADVFSGYVAVQDGKLLQIGKGEPGAALIDSRTKVYELGERLICPGFSDVHCFFTGYALGFIGVDLSCAKSQNEIISLAKGYAATLPAQKSVLGHGCNPALCCADTAALDEAFGTRPAVLLAQGGETCLMNTAAIKKYGFDPSCCYAEAVWRLLAEMLQDKAYILPLFESYMQMMNSRGVTGVKEMGFDDFYGFTDILQQLEADGKLTLRVNFMSQPVSQNANLAFGRAMRQRFTGDYVRFSGYNRMTDGSISQMCGDLKQPYTCAPHTTCAQQIDWDLIAAETRAVDAEDFRFSLHAQGDGAIGKVVDIYETCKRDENGRLLNRHSITDLEFSHPADLERMGKLGVIAEVYPQIQSIANRAEKLAMIEEKIGAERGAYYWNRRKMADSGVLLSCGTDLPLLIDDIPQSVYHAVGGFFPEGGEPFNVQNMLTVKELLTAWTYGGAYNLYSENCLGTLECGKLADIAVLDTNLFKTPAANARDAKVCLTLVGGNVVFENL